MNKFSIGQQWYCARSSTSHIHGLPNIWFVIVGTPSDKDPTKYKVCQVRHSRTEHPDDFVATYSHKHLKEHASWIDPDFVKELIVPCDFTVVGPLQWVE